MIAEISTSVILPLCSTSGPRFVNLVSIVAAVSPAGARDNSSE
jgi:hypothetical protein